MVIRRKSLETLLDEYSHYLEMRHRVARGDYHAPPVGSLDEKLDELKGEIGVQLNSKNPLLRE